MQWRQPKWEQMRFPFTKIMPTSTPTLTQLQRALASVVWILNPEIIVIGGGVAKAGALVFDPIRRSICSRTSRVFHEKLNVVPASLGNDAGIIGSAALASAQAASAAPLL